MKTAILVGGLLVGGYFVYDAIKAPVVTTELGRYKYGHATKVLIVFVNGKQIEEEIRMGVAMGTTILVKSNLFAKFFLKIQTIANEKITVELLHNGKVLQTIKTYVPIGG